MQARHTRDNNSLIPIAKTWAIRLLTESPYYWHLFSLIFIGQVALCALVIRYVAYTNIDYLAYTEQAALFLPPNNVRDYAQLKGGTGPLVYPAFHLYIYATLHRLLPAASDPDVGGFVPGKSDLERGLPVLEGRESLRRLQYLWAGVYLATLLLVGWIYRQVIASVEPRTTATAHKKERREQPRTRTPVRSLSRLVLGPSPPLQPFLLLLPLSKRLHSIYMLRLFNDPLAMLSFYAAVICMHKRQWYVGAAVYSLALGIKMNILLFLPGLLVLLFQYKGPVGTILALSIILSIQLLLPAPFFLASRASAAQYFSSAFDLGREFTFKWSVNWRWLGEPRFASDELKWGLLGSHLLALLVFAGFKWSAPVPGGTLTVLDRGLSSIQGLRRAPLPQGPESGLHIPFVLFTSNMLGILFARSLHYQFFSWYAHQLPFLLWLTRWPLLICGAVWLIVLWVWDTFPPSVGGSFVLFLIHAAVLARVFWNGEKRA
ncbi:dolichyl-P-Man:Man(5)GlcNAc(2)-PP-dolichol alpha-1,3-mannosyltransferase [Naganishia albida]|nr:dolichyl-P-Man:Man(5)GlcNAc(2)-PP-dolichol alpha-1,3-mannosyltransferase [Naganishia albida]